MSPSADTVPSESATVTRMSDLASQNIGASPSRKRIKLGLGDNELGDDEDTSDNCEDGFESEDSSSGEGNPFHKYWSNPYNECTDPQPIDNFSYEDCDKLPNDSPIGHPHVIKDPKTVASETHLKAYRICDGVATVLWNFNRGALEAFFDMDFKVCQLAIEREGFTWLIRREKHTVHVVVYERLNIRGEELVEYDVYCRSTIQPDGSWKDAFGSQLGTARWGDGLPMWDTCYSREDGNPRERCQASYVGSFLTREMFLRSIWKADVAEKITWTVVRSDD